MLTKLSLKKIVDTPKPDDKQPSHALIASDEKFQNKTTVGKMWLKKGEYGNFLAGELSKPRTHEGKEYDGYVIITTKEYERLISNQSPIPNFQVGTGEVLTEDVPF